MLDPQSAFEKLCGKKTEAEYPEKWEKDFFIYFSGWKDGYLYRNETKELENDMRALSDLQRGVI